jgi:DNA repair exonuclease SbcCD nuclease subunit
MARFLHIADVHLGIRRYNLPDRTLDFFRAWREVLERHAIGRRVDFVVIAGDLFDQRRVDPQAANHAMVMLRELEQHKIPVIVVEGNHDQRESASKFSWLRSFSQWGFIKLLEPSWEEGGKIRLDAWDPESKTGSYIDIGDARIFGSTWYGTTIGQTLPVLGAAVHQNRRPGATNIAVLHCDIEGQLNRPIPAALPTSRLRDLRDAVDYLALGHTHKRFEIDGWVFNPGSLEACNVEEANTTRGAYVVETDGPTIKTEFVEAGKDFFQRPFQRLDLEIGGDEEPDAVGSAVMGLIERQCGGLNHAADDEKPIIEVTLRGQIGFKNSMLRLDKLKEQAMERFKPMGLIINNKTVPKQLAVAVDVSHDAPRFEREARVIEDLIKPDPRFRDRASELANLIIEIKRLALEKEGSEKMFNLIEERLFGSPGSAGGASCTEATPLALAEASD